MLNNNEREEVSFGTKLVQAKPSSGRHHGALSTPIYQASTFHQFSLSEPGKFDYSRSGNPTREALEQTIAELEGGYAGFAFSSGMAAISSVFCLLSAGDEVLLSDDIYGGTYRAITKLFPRFGIRGKFVDTTNTEAVRAAITSATRAIFLESPSNPQMNITDIEEVSRIAKQWGLLTIVDNTFMTPYLQRPLELGADIVVHSATKYIGGHSDVVGGLVVAASQEISDEIGFIQNAFGAILGPQDSWLLLRGLKTLKVRMDQHEKNARQIASWLASRSEVEAVYYPGLPEHPGHELALKQAKGFGGMISFTLGSVEQVEQFLHNLTLPALAVSLGAVESIITYPARMSHASIPEEQRKQMGVTDTLLRISVGIEDAEDVIRDFEQAFRWIDSKVSHTI
ncbi:trans-sulfuration enzyme family protein [Aneurinibacillus migulanus]|uniref:trans-sulfuration enzyme family protein n=1 Tax=Aneurinibacillus migulanus TaxID=47500 RepID=UPI0005C31560|nr:PLP-dependent aspartate aminotransferase family protein [Aneurinibacillus migulanus]KIV50878.1 cystathionine gamma-synthase [Aneurinibacillus migulanus]MCP1354907.1 PLP-dependent aspartate aminotransferase family protein [Aneurinibacillus migulanus]CEH31629.1 Cystathionine beta-lyase [Aneurinibacillus migulanus]